MYPVLKMIQEEVVDGGWRWMLYDLIFFALKTFIFVGVGYLALLSFGLAFTEHFLTELPGWCEKI